MNAKMKVLSLALVGLCGYAGSALAVCPAGPTIAEGGAWTSSTVLGTGSVLAIATPGLDASACKLTAALGASVSSAALVRDDTPVAEPRYRFQFLIDPSTLSAFTATDNVVAFQTPATTVANGVTRTVRVSLVAGPAGAKRLRFLLACDTGPTFLCGQTIATDLIAGVNRIEGDLVVGATGSLRVWENAPAGTVEPAPTATIATGVTTPWGGTEAAQMGLVAPSTAFKNSHATQPAGFDTFDSRRSTYIGS